MGGVGPTEYHVKAVGSAPARAKLLETGEIDAALQPFPLSYEAEAKGFTNLGWTGDYQPDWQFTALVVNRAWAAEYPALMTGYLRAILRGRAFMDCDREASVRIAADALHTTPALARRALADTDRLKIMDKHLAWSAAGLVAIHEGMVQSGALPADARFDIARITDGRWLASAREPKR